MASWRRRRFMSLQEDYESDSVAAGSQFVVKVIGSTSIDKESDNASSITDRNFTKIYSDLMLLFSSENGSKLRMVIDLCGAVLYNKEGQVLKSFRISNIRDIVYSTTREEFARYFIMIAREQNELNIKAHILLCEDKQKAKLLYETFAKLFGLSAEEKKRRERGKENILKTTRLTHTDNANIKRHSVSVDGRLTNLRQQVSSQQNVRNNGTTPKMFTNLVSKMSIIEPDLDESFTELARSRSSFSK